MIIRLSQPQLGIGWLAWAEHGKKFKWGGVGGGVSAKNEKMRNSKCGLFEIKEWESPDFQVFPNVHVYFKSFF